MEGGLQVVCSRHQATMRNVQGAVGALVRGSFTRNPPPSLHRVTARYWGVSAISAYRRLSVNNEIPLFPVRRLYGKRRSSLRLRSALRSLSESLQQLMKVGSSVISTSDFLRQI